MCKTEIACFSFILGVLMGLLCCGYTLGIIYPDPGCSMSGEYEVTIRDDDLPIDEDNKSEVESDEYIIEDEMNDDEWYF